MVLQRLYPMHGLIVDGVCHACLLACDELGYANRVAGPPPSGLKWYVVACFLFGVPPFRDEMPTLDVI